MAKLSLDLMRRILIVAMTVLATSLNASGKAAASSTLKGILSQSPGA
jgi:hypothetical protein